MPDEITQRQIPRLRLDNLPRPSSMAASKPVNGPVDDVIEMPRPAGDGASGDYYKTLVAAGINPRDLFVADRTPWLAIHDLLPNGRPAGQWSNLLVQVWLDYPKAIADLWTPQEGSGEDGKETPDEAAERMLEACRATFLAHAIRKPGQKAKDTPEPLLDADGNPVPWLNPATGEPHKPISSEEFWSEISTPLGGAIVQRFFTEMAANPTSGGASSRRRNQRR